MIQTLWHIEGRVPMPGIENPWVRLYSWPDPVTEENVDTLLAVYRRAMPQKGQ